MNILILTRHFHSVDRPSGVISLIREFIPAFTKLGHEVRLACLKNNTESDFYIDDSGLAIYKLNKFSPFTLKRINKEFSPDHIIIFSSISKGVLILIWWFAISLFGKTINRTSFYQTTNLELSSSKSLLFKKIVKQFNLIFCANKAIVNAIGLDKTDGSIILPGTDLAALTKIGKSNHCREKQFSVCFMGHLTLVKGADIILDLAERLPHIHFNLIAGYSPGKKNVNFYNDIVERIQEIKNVRHYKFNENPIPLLANNNLLVLPYRSGATVLGVAQSAIEAMTLGIPVIASDNTAVREILISGYNGYHAQSLDEYESRILSIVSDNNHYNYLSANAIQTVKSNFDIHQQALKVLEIIRNHAGL